MCSITSKILKTTKNIYPSKDAEIILLIAHKNYPNNSNISSSGITFYDKYKINEIAFLSNEFSLPLFSIISLILQSHIKASLLIDKLLNAKNGMYFFAKYLQNYHNMFLINECGNEKNIQNILSDFPKQKVLLIGSEHCNTLWENRSSIMRIPHPGNQAYVYKPKDCCDTYFTFTFEDKNSTLTLNDFRIKL